MKIWIDISDDEASILRKRGKKNMLTLKEMIEDIVRRSCINAKKTKIISSDCDDKLVGLFSRNRRGKK